MRLPQSASGLFPCGIGRQHQPAPGARDVAMTRLFGVLPAQAMIESHRRGVAHGHLEGGRGGIRPSRRQARPAPCPARASPPPRRDDARSSRPPDGDESARAAPFSATQISSPRVCSAKSSSRNRAGSTQWKAWRLPLRKSCASMGSSASVIILIMTPSLRCVLVASHSRWIPPCCQIGNVDPLEYVTV